MLKWYTQPAKRYKGLLYRSRDIILDEKMIEKVLKVPEAIVVSSWRSLEEQKQMVAKGASKTLKSNHRRGMAVDIKNWSELDKQLEAAGLVNDISWDKNHYTLEGEARTALKYPMYDSFIKNESTKYKPNTKNNITIKEEKLPDMKLLPELRAFIEEETGENYGENFSLEEQRDALKKLEEARAKRVQSVLDTAKELDILKSDTNIPKVEQTPLETQNMKPESVLNDIVKILSGIMRK